MDKYEYKLKLDELKELFQLKNYKGAAAIADEINWKKVRNSKTLCMVADVYEAVERYDACQEVLMQAYDHSSVGRNIVSRLTDIAIKSKDVPSAEEYYNEFLELAPKDTQRYVFAYKIACLKNAPLADRIAILEEFKEKEYSEMWAYELAVLYAQAGMREKCVETSDELILWFGNGEYVERALDLKRSFQPLTAAQEEKYQRLRSQKNTVEFNIPQKTEAAGSNRVNGRITDGITPEMTVTASKFNTQNLQEEIASRMQQIVEATEENTVRDRMNSIRKIVQDIPYLEGEEDAAISQREEIQQQVSRELRSDFQEKLVEETVYGQAAAQNQGGGLSEDTSGLSIEEILADWEKTKLVAQQVMAAAKQRELDLEKEQALAEASAIMRRLEELVPILSATPGEDIPDSSEGTVADELLSAEPIVLKVKEPEEQLTYDLSGSGTDAGGLSEEAAATSPLQQVFTRAGHKQSRNPQDPMADVESLEDWLEEDESEADETSGQQDDSSKASGVDFKAAAAEFNAAAAAAANLGSARSAEPEEDVPEEEEAETESSLTEEEIWEPTEEALIAAAMEEPEDISEEPVEELTEDVASEEAEGESAEAEEEEEEEEEEDWGPTEEALIAAAMGELGEDIPEGPDDVPEGSGIPEEEALVTEAEDDTENEVWEPEEGSMDGEPADEVPTEEAVPAAAEPAEEIPAEAEDEFFDDEEEFFDADEPTVEIDTDRIAAFLMAQTDVLSKEPGKPAAAPEPVDNDIMTDEIREYFSYFIPIPGMSEQIEQVLGDIVRIKNDAVTSSRGNVIIQGEEGSGKTMLATDLVKAAQKVMDRPDDKIAKISAQALNKRNFSSLIPRIAGGYMIVENAGELNEETAANMSQVMEHDTNGMTLILEDDGAGIRRMVSLNSAFSAKFTEKIQIPIFTIDELVDFGKAYAFEQECEIEDMAVLALYNRITNIQKIDRPTTLTEVKKIVDEAISHAESGGIKKLFSKKYNDKDFLILHEDDFEV